MEKINSHPELSNKEGSLANCLLTNKNLIEAWHKTLPVNNMIASVRELVISINDKPLEKKSVATKRFLNSLAKQRSKDQVLMLVWNTIMAGDNEKVIK